MNKEELVTNNIGLARNVAKKVWNNCSSYYDLEDLVSLAYCSLVKASNTFNASKGAKFSTYAYKCMWNELVKYVTNKNRVSSKQNEVYCLYSTKENKDGDEIEEINFLEGTLEDPTAVYVKRFIEEVIDKEWGRFKRKNEQLDRNKKILIDYFVNGYTQQDLAEIYGITRQNVNLICKKFIISAEKFITK